MLKLKSSSSIFGIVKSIHLVEVPNSIGNLNFYYAFTGIIKGAGVCPEYLASSNRIPKFLANSIRTVYPNLMSSPNSLFDDF